MAGQVDKDREEFKQSRKQQVRKVLAVIERHRKEATRKRLNFTAPDEEQLIKKLPGAKSPMIVFQSWGGSVPNGGTLSYNIGIYNPDAFTQIWMFVHLFIGPANMVPDVGAALATVDSRFPRLALPKFAGLNVSSGGSATLNFSIPIPAIIEPSNYLGNSFLFRADWHDVGDYFDRSIFVFEVT